MTPAAQWPSITPPPEQTPARHAPLPPKTTTPVVPDKGEGVVWGLGIVGVMLIMLGVVWILSTTTLAVLTVYPLASSVVVSGVVCLVGALVIRVGGKH